MALSAKAIKIGAVVSGRCGQRKFAGTVVEATDVTITVQDADGETTEIAPAWADVLVVDGQDTPAPGPMATPAPKRIAFKEYRPRLPGNIADIERQRADKNYQAVTEWKAKRKQEDTIMMTQAERIAAMNAAKAKGLAKPATCKDCQAEFKRKSLAAKRCPDCIRKHRLEESRRRSAGYRAAAKAALGAPVSSPAPEKPVAGELPLLEGERPREPLATVPPAPVKPSAGPAEAGTINLTPAAGIDRGQVRKCVLCGCTDLDCSGCIARTGQPCHWIDDKINLCSACADRIRKLAERHPTADEDIGAPRNQHRRLVPITALERAHGVIQGLWLEIARLQALVEG